MMSQRKKELKELGLIDGLSREEKIWVGRMSKENGFMEFDIPVGKNLFS